MAGHGPHSRPPFQTLELCIRPLWLMPIYLSHPASGATMHSPSLALHRPDRASSVTESSDNWGIYYPLLFVVRADTRAHVFIDVINVEK